MIIFSASGWAGLIPALTTMTSSGTLNGNREIIFDGIWPFTRHAEKRIKNTTKTRVKEEEAEKYDDVVDEEFSSKIIFFL